MSCGPGKGLEGLQKELDAAKESLAGLQGDLAGGIEDLKGKLEGLAGGVMGGMKSMMPTIELPELPDLKIELPELELPEIPVIDSLQTGIGDLLNVINDPLSLLKIGGPDGLDKELAKLKEKFGDKMPDIDQLKKDLLSGKIDTDNLCKLIPNAEIDQAKPDEVAEKATPVTAPEADAEKIPAPEPAPAAKKIVNDTPPQSSTDVNASGETRAQVKEKQIVDKEIQQARSSQEPKTETEIDEINKRLMNQAYKNNIKYISSILPIRIKEVPLFGGTKILTKYFNLTWQELWIEVFAVGGEEPGTYGKIKYTNDELREKQKELSEKYPKITTWDFQKEGQLMRQNYNDLKEIYPYFYDADDFDTAAKKYIGRVKSKAVK